MKTKLLNKFFLFTCISVLGMYQINAQNVNNVVVTPNGQAPISVTTSGVTTIQVEVGNSFTVDFNVFHASIPIERSFSVVKIGDPATGTNFFNASNSTLTYDIASDAANGGANPILDYTAPTRTFNIPADGGTTAASATVTIGDKHTLRLNGKRWTTSTTSDWGTAFDVIIELVDQGTLSTKKFNALESVKLYPNPTTDRLNISCPAGTDLEVYNVLGVKVKSETGVQENHSMNVSNLSSGLYFMKLSLEGTTTTIKFQVK